VIRHSAFTVDPWRLREDALDLDVLAQTESIFALANGHIGLRGNLDEGEPAGMPGTYLNSVFDLRPLAYVEPGYGFPESGQTVINVTNGKLIRLLVDDEPFDIRYGRLTTHERVLDLRAGTLERRAEWTSPAGQGVRLRTVRLVSFAQRAAAAISYEVEPVGNATRIVVQSELIANEPLPAPPFTTDPRGTAAMESPLLSEDFSCRELRAKLVHRTKNSGLRVAAAMDHVIEGPPGTQAECESAPDTGRVTVSTRLEAGQRLRITKFLAYGWSRHRSRQALSDQVLAALTAARNTGWEGMLAEQRAYLDDFWEGADVELQGDDEVQQAVRFALFQILQAAARGEDRPIPAKGLTGLGYDGHAFWDTETFVVPLLAYTMPAAAASALRWRHSTLPAALERARVLGQEGAAFPWRTIDGHECSGYWPASTAAFHINADIANAVMGYVYVTGDDEFERDFGLELLVHTARLWRSLGYTDAQGRFRIDGVTGPDEYSAIADNNVYTNLLAQLNLRGAADACARHPERAGDLGVTADELSAWHSAANAILIPYDERLGVHPQADSFTEHEVWDFAATPPDNYPLLLHYHYFDLYRKQVVKQPDLVLAMLVCAEAFTDEQKVRNFDYYEGITVRDSSLSAGTQAVMAAEVGQLDLAYDYLGESVLLDLRDLEHNTRDGVHIAALAGAWMALVGGFGGLRPKAGGLGFAPRLPDGIERLVFNLLFRKRRLRITTTHASAVYELRDGEPIETSHHGRAFTLTAGQPVSWPIPPAPVRPRPSQPRGREPVPRRARNVSEQSR
jgi:alpha,alpha-trehalose phosphorylase